MTVISKEKIKGLYSANLLYEIHIVNEKISLFKKKYNMSFSEFENFVNGESESFEKWDDYLEWKGYQRNFVLLKTKEKDLRNGNIRVA